MQTLIKRYPVVFTALILFVLCFMTYGPVLSHQFMIDDFGFANPERVPAAFENFTDFFTISWSHHYDPLNYLVNVGLFHVFPSPGPLYFINIVLFYLNCLFLFLLVLSISKDYRLSFLTSVLFCIHPMNAEMVQHITFNIVFITTLLLEFSLLAFLRYLENIEKRHFYLFSITLFTVALLGQDLIALSFPLYLVCLLYFLKKYNIKKTLKTCLPFIGVSLLGFSAWLTFAGPHIQLLERAQAHHLNFWGYIANYALLLKWYISNLFFPSSVVWMYNITPTTNHTGLFLFLFLSAIFCLAGLIIFYTKKGLESFALVFFLAGFPISIPATMIRPKMGIVVEPYWFYLSSIGFFLFIALMILKIKHKLDNKIFIAFVSAIFVFFFFHTQKINTMAKTELSYAENWLRKSPSNSMALMRLGTIYIYTEGVDIPEDLLSEMVKMVDTYIERSDDERAIKLAKKILLTETNQESRLKLFCKLAAVYYRSGEMKQYKKTTAHILQNKQFPIVYIQLSQAFADISLPEVAGQFLKQCMILHPQFADAYLLQGIIFANQDQFQEGIRWWKKGQAIDPTDIRFQKHIRKAQTLL